MSSEHDQHPTPEEARAFGRWLDRPGDPPPEDLDEDVLQAVYAIRPDLAPAPQVSIDDILEGVSAGPFASDEGAEPASQTGEGADIVPFPAPEPAPETEGGGEPPSGKADRPGTTVRWAGGIGGAGLALVVAATLLLTLFPREPSQLATEMSPAVAMDEAPQKAELEHQIAEAPAEAAPARDLMAAPAPAPSVEPRPAAAAPEPTAAPAARPRAVVAAPEEAEAEPTEPVADEVADLGDVAAPAAVEPDSYDIEGRSALSQRSVIPEVAAQSTEAVDELEAKADDTVQAREAEEAGPGGYTTPSWWAGAPTEVRVMADNTLARANALAARGKPAQGADLLAAALTGPGPVAHQLAIRAAELYLEAGDPAAARSVLRRAATFGSPTADQRARVTALGQQLAE